MTGEQRSIRHYLSIIWGILGWRYLTLLALTLVATLLDGVGLALFLPLLQVSEGSITPESLGRLAVLMDMLETLHIPKTTIGVFIVMTSVFGVKGLVKFTEGALGSKLKADTIMGLRHRFVDSVGRVKFVHLLKQDSGYLSHVFGGELNKAVTAIFLFVVATATLCMVIAYVLMAGLVNFWFTALTLVFMTPAGLIVRFLNQRTKMGSTLLATGNSEFQSRITQMLQNAKYLLATGTLPHMRHLLDDDIAALRLQQYRLGLHAAAIKGLREPIILAALLGLIFVHINMSEAPLLNVLFVLLLVYRALSSLMNFHASWQSFLAMSSSIDLVLSHLSSLEGEAKSEGPVRVDGLPYPIKFDNVCFSFGDKNVLENVTLSIPQHTMLAVVGPSGAGKSTFVNLLTGLLQPTKGVISYGPTDLSKLNHTSLHPHIGYITQEPVVFKESIHKNIMLWSESEVPSELREAAALEFVDDLPLGLDTQVGDRGLRLSGGQRQRICLARELAKDLNLLILDEATSSLDPVTEQVIRDTITAMKRKCTIVMITHRIDHALDADLVAYFEEGALIEFGAPDQLLRRPESKLALLAQRVGQA